MSEADAWKLPRPPVLRSVVADEPNAPLTAAECTALRCHPRLRYGVLAECLTAAEMNRLRFVAWCVRRGYVSEVR